MEISVIGIVRVRLLFPKENWEKVRKYLMDNDWTIKAFGKYFHTSGPKIGWYSETHDEVIAESRCLLNEESLDDLKAKILGELS